MAQVKLLKINSAGLPQEFDDAADEITLASFSVQGGGPVLGATGLDMNNLDVSDVQDLSFTDPTTGTINQTAGAIIVDNLMGKDRANLIASTGDIQFGVITDAAGEVDSLVLPKLPGAPSAVPTGGEGSFLYDSTNDKLWIYTTAGWDDLSTVSSAGSVVNSYIAGEDISVAEVVYISGANEVSLADASTVALTLVVGVAKTAALDTAAVEVQSEGVLAGFSGLTPGARYFLATTPGAVSTSAPTGAGHSIVQIGYAKNATNMHLHIAQVGRRAA